MYTFRFPPKEMDDHFVLIPGQSRHVIVNALMTDNLTRMLSCSIQAVASHAVHVEVMMSNLPNKDRDHLTWMPCPSIPPFTVPPNENYFNQFSFHDVASHFLFKFASVEENDILVPSVKLQMVVCFGDVPMA